MLCVRARPWRVQEADSHCGNDIPVGDWIGGSSPPSCGVAMARARWPQEDRPPLRTDVGEGRLGGRDPFDPLRPQTAVDGHHVLRPSTAR